MRKQKCRYDIERCDVIALGIFFLIPSIMSIISFFIVFSMPHIDIKYSYVVWWTIFFIIGFGWWILLVKGNVK